MEKMFEMMIKSMGFDPAQVKLNVENAAKIAKAMGDQLNRIENNQKLIANHLGIVLNKPSDANPSLPVTITRQDN